MAITVYFVGQLEWKHKRKNRKRKGISDNKTPPLIILLFTEDPMGGLTDIKTKKISARARLEKKIMNK